jgi:nucleotide-binding universal stress UspA family protein
MADTIVVGIDGSAESRRAMEWAWEEARRRNSPVRLLHGAPDSYGDDVTGSWVRDLYVEDARRVVDEAKSSVPADLVDRCDAKWTVGRAARVLVHASEGARLVVVGTHGRGALGTLVHGSVSRHVIRHARCSVVVVRTAAGGPRVVVGLDTRAPEPALPAAFEQAAARAIPLTVIRAMPTPALVDAGLAAAGVGVNLDDLERRERSEAEKLVAPWSAKHPEVAVDVRVVAGDPRQVLIEASQDGDLVVVGAHGGGWFSGLTLGSTSAAAAEHGHCPVLVAR